MGCQSSEFQKFMLFQPLGEVDIVEIIEAVDRIPQRLVIFFLNEQIVVSIINGLEVKLRLNISIKDSGLPRLEISHVERLLDKTGWAECGPLCWTCVQRGCGRYGESWRKADHWEGWDVLGDRRSKLCSSYGNKGKFQKHQKNVGLTFPRWRHGRWHPWTDYVPMHQQIARSLRERHYPSRHINKQKQRTSTGLRIHHIWYIRKPIQAKDVLFQRLW